LGEEEPRPILDSGTLGHPLELVQGRDDVEHAQALDDVRMIERHPVSDPPATVVPDDGEALVPEPRHQLDELGRPLAVAVALAQRTARRGAALAIALQVADDDCVVRGETGRNPMPAVVRLGEPVEEQDGRPIAGYPRPIARWTDLDRRVLESLDHGFRLAIRREVTPGP